MKKIIGFVIGQISLIVSILCTFGFFYMLYDFSNNTQKANVFYEEIIYDNYQIIIDLNTGMLEKNEILKIDVNDIKTNEIYFKLDSIWQIALISSVILTIILDIIYWVFCIINAIRSFFVYLKCKKLLKEKYDLDDERLYELPKYEPIIANAIYKKKYQYDMVSARLEYYYRISGVLDRYNRLKDKSSSDTSSLTELEKIIMKKYQRNEETRKLTSQEKDEEYYKNRREFKSKINEILKEKRYYKEDIVKTKVKAFCKAIRKIKENKKDFFKSDEVRKKILIFIAFVIVILIFKIVMLAAIIFGIWILIKYYGITLTEDGELERAKIIFLIRYLKKKKILSEEENYFLTVLTIY